MYSCTSCTKELMLKNLRIADEIMTNPNMLRIIIEKQIFNIDLPIGLTFNNQAATSTFLLLISLSITFLNSPSIRSFWNGLPTNKTLPKPSKTNA